MNMYSNWISIAVHASSGLAIHSRQLIYFPHDNTIGHESLMRGAHNEEKWKQKSAN